MTAGWPFPRWIAHRRAVKLAPENALAAFRLGAAHGHHAFGCDVKLSADGAPFRLHDPTLERTTNATGVAVGHACTALRRGGAAPLSCSSFRPEALPGALESALQIPRALLLDLPWEGWFATARQLGCEAVLTNHRCMDEALIAQLRGAGLRALCCTVNDCAEAEHLLALGIDGLITDAVDRFAPAAGDVGT